MPKVSEAHLEARRQQVLDAAFACFGRKGFHPTTMQDICREAGLSPGAVYRYFASKEAIISSSCEGTREVNLALLGQAVASSGGTSRLVQRLAELFFLPEDAPDAPTRQRAMLQLWAEMVVNKEIGDLHRGNLAAISKALERVVGQAQADGDFAGSLDRESVARVMMALYDGFLVQKALDPAVKTGPFVAVAVALFTGRFWTGRRPAVRTPRPRPETQTAAPSRGSTSKRR